MVDLPISDGLAAKRLVRATTAVAHRELSTHSELATATAFLTSSYGKLPTLDELRDRLGASFVDGVVTKFLAKRRQRLLVCHICSGSRAAEDPEYRFALAKDVKTSVDPVRAVTLAVLNLVAVPFFGRAVGGSLTSTSATVYHCRLQLCASCGERRGHKLGQEDCSRHPEWDALVSQGYERFLDSATAREFDSPWG